MTEKTKRNGTNKAKRLVDIYKMYTFASKYNHIFYLYILL